MSGSGNSGEVKNNKRKKKKNEKWEEAGGEFYQERYPAGDKGQGQATSTADLTLVVERPVPQNRSHFPLPSQTARRNSLAHTGGRRGYLTRNARKHQKQSPYEVNTTLNNGTSTRVNCMTYNSTMGRIVEDSSDVHISLMPDMADETIPDEKSTYDALLKIKALPESMSQKRARKVKLGNIPQRRLSGWLRLKWASQKKWLHLRQAWRHDLPKLRLWGESLHGIETQCDRSVASVFLYLRHTLLLNLLISGVILSLLILSNKLELLQELAPVPGEGCTSPGEGHNNSWSPEDRLGCCTLEYFAQVQNESWSDALSLIEVGVSNISFFPSTSYSLLHSPPFYGYYLLGHEDSKFQNYFAFGYVLLTISYLVVSLLFILQGLGQGIKEMIMASEGEYNSYTNLIFAGWDNGTKDAKSAAFKRKLLFHEMKVSLKNEKQLLEKVLRSRNQQLKLGLIRVFVNLIVFAAIFGTGIGIYLTTIESLKWEEMKMTLNDTNSNSNSNATSSEEEWKNYGWSFAPATLITLLHVLFPPILSWIGKFEKYSTPTASALVLYRSLIIRMISLGFAALGVVQLKYCRLRNISTCTECESSNLFDLDGDSIKSRDPCWESLIAYQLYKLLLVDFLVKLFLTLVLQPLRLQLKKCCKNKAIQSIGTMRFSIIRHNLDIIYIQFLCWIGIYFAPFLPFATVFYAFLVFYVKKLSLLHNCNQVPDALKTMKTTSTFVAAKLIALVVATSTNVYIIGYMTPSRGCGPFRKYTTPWEAVTRVVTTCPDAIQVYQVMASPTITIPTTLILLLLGYYYYSVAQTNRCMVDTLRHLLVLEGHDKQYLFGRLNSLRRGSVGGGTGIRSRSGLPSLNHSALPTPPPDPSRNT